MDDSDQLQRFIRTKVRSAGRQVEQARQAFVEGRKEAFDAKDGADVPIVCRRYAEKRRVRLDPNARPHCFDAGHPDCEGCVEDIRAGRIETW